MTTLFGTTSDGRDVHAIEIGSQDLSVNVLTYGAILNDVRLRGVAHPLTLGAPELAAYEGPLASFGALMGPVANRIKDARAEIDGTTHHFEANFQGQHTLHSGSTGTQHQVWEIEKATEHEVSLSLYLSDGLGGFPGNRQVRVLYSVEGATLTMEIAAESDRHTLFSFANHSYWALDSGAQFADHMLTVPAGRYLEVDDALLPTGRILPVDGSAYDARGGLTLTGTNAQFFDLNYCFCDGDRAPHEAARIVGRGGVTLSLETTAPGLQVYDCGTINAAGFATHHGAAYGPYSGLALEAQRWPAASTHSGFPKIHFAPHERFHQLTRWRFQR